MKYLDKNDAARLQGMFEMIGADPIILALAEMVEREFPRGTDLAMRACHQSFAADLRAAIRRREDSKDLVAYRRDWSHKMWLMWLDAELDQRPPFAREIVRMLEGAGCSDPYTVATEYMHRRFDHAQMYDRHSLPPAGDDEGWVAFVRHHAGELTDAQGSADVAYWLACRGFSKDAASCTRFLREKRVRFQDHIRRLLSLPDPTPGDAADTTMFGR